MACLPIWMWLKLAFSLVLLVGCPVFVVWPHLPETLLSRVVFVLALFLFASLIISWLFISRPIHKLIRVMEEAEKHDFLKRAPVHSRDVIGQLSRSFNHLLERMTTLDAFKFEAERKLIDAQKELKFKRVLEEKKEIIERTNQSLEVRVKELDLIHEFSEKIVSTLNLDELYQILDEFLGEKVGFKEFALLVCEERSGAQQAKARIARGFPDCNRVLGMVFGENEGVTGYVMKSKKLCYVPDISKDPRYLSYKGELRGGGSFLSIPLSFKSRLVGVLNLNRPGTDSFSPQEIQFLNTIGVGIAIALVNAGLYSRTHELAVRDELTHLFNRRYFQVNFPLEIKRAQRSGQSVSLLMLDLDRFKKFNDTYGHLEGDRRLKNFSELLIANVREVDLVARFGGEEFVILLPNTSKESAVIVAEKLRDLVRSHHFSEGSLSRNVPMTVSIGVASYPMNGETVEAVLDAADNALYEAKRSGRDRVVASSSLKKRAPSSSHPNTASSLADSSRDKRDDRLA